jgi:hypothetical protein
MQQIWGHGILRRGAAVVWIARADVFLGGIDVATDCSHLAGLGGPPNKGDRQAGRGIKDLERPTARPFGPPLPA